MEHHQVVEEELLDGGRDEGESEKNATDLVKFCGSLGKTLF